MTNLLDIASLSEEITISKGVTVTLYGITIESLLKMMSKFPEIKLLMERRASDITPQRIMEMTPKVAAYIIGVGMTDPDTDDIDKAATTKMKIARRIGLSDQLKIINKIFEITFPDGVGPFVEELQHLTRSFKVETRVEEQESSSPGGLSASLVTDGPLPMPYGLRRVS
jgi:hypothetical protein